MTSEIKNKQRQPVRKESGFKRSEFINYDLTQDDKAGFKAWLSGKSFNLWDLVDKLIESGYTLSVKPDEYHHCTACYIQPVSPDSPNSGYILSGRAASGTMAVCGALYRHLVVFECDWPVDTVRRSGLDDE